MNSEWNYCPECGHLEFTDTTYSRGRFCDRCGQEWFPDLDYSDVVIKKLAALAAANERNSVLEARLEIDPSHPIDGIEARDATIKLLDERIMELGANSQEATKLADDYLRLNSHYSGALEQLAAEREVSDKLERTLDVVCEGWTLPDAVRKILETALAEVAAIRAGGK